VDGERVGEAQQLQKSGVAQKVGELLGRGGDNAGAIERILQSGNLGENCGQRGHLNVMPEEAAQLKRSGGSAGVHGIIIASASAFDIDGALILEAGTEMAGRIIHSDGQIHGGNARPNGDLRLECGVSAASVNGEIVSPLEVEQAAGGERALAQRSQIVIGLVQVQAGVKALTHLAIGVEVGKCSVLVVDGKRGEVARLRAEVSDNVIALVVIRTACGKANAVADAELGQEIAFVGEFETVNQ